MKGEVAWMDTLRMTHWKSWQIKTVLDGAGFYRPYYIELGPGKTLFVERLKNALEPNPVVEPETSKSIIQKPVVNEPVKTTKKGQILLFD
jgi:hypothetical protein